MFQIRVTVSISLNRKAKTHGTAVFVQILGPKNRLSSLLGRAFQPFLDPRIDQFRCRVVLFPFSCTQESTNFVVGSCFFNFLGAKHGPAAAVAVTAVAGALTTTTVAAITTAAAAATAVAVVAATAVAVAAPAVAVTTGAAAPQEATATGCRKPLSLAGGRRLQWVARSLCLFGP